MLRQARRTRPSRSACRNSLSHYTQYKTVAPKYELVTPQAQGRSRDRCDLILATTTCTTGTRRWRAYESLGACNGRLQCICGSVEPLSRDRLPTQVCVAGKTMERCRRPAGLAWRHDVSHQDRFAHAARRNSPQTPLTANDERNSLLKISFPQAHKSDRALWLPRHVSRLL